MHEPSNLPHATGPCMTAVWTLKRGDNLISTHVNAAARVRSGLRAYCVSVTSSCSLWPQEWKIFKWLWCSGSCWTALMVGKHLSPAAIDVHPSYLYPFICVNYWKCVCLRIDCRVCSFRCIWGNIYTAIIPSTPAKTKHKCRVYTGTTLRLRAVTAASICQSRCGYCCSTGRQTARACGPIDLLCQQVIISN